MPVVTAVSALEAARRAHGLSRADLAHRAGIHRETLAGIERGALPHLRTAQAIARVLGVGVDELFPLDERTSA